MERTPDEEAPSKELEVRSDPDRSNMDVEFNIEWEIKPLDVNFGTEEEPNTLTFLPDNHYVAIYRLAPEYNRIEHTDEEGNIRTIYDHQTLIDWLIGFVLSEYTTDVPRNRARQSMFDLCGFNSQVFVGFKPSAEEKARYELSQCGDLYPLEELTADAVIDNWAAEDEADEV